MATLMASKLYTFLTKKLLLITKMLQGELKISSSKNFQSYFAFLGDNKCNNETFIQFFKCTNKKS